LHSYPFLSLSVSTPRRKTTMISAAVFTQLIHKLRNANARYTHIALIYRSTLRRTYHAKRRAYWTGLHINTLQAQNCPNSHVSLQPLPVIDSDPATSELELEKPAFPVPSMSKSTTTSISTSVHALGLELANLPEIVVSPPTSLPQHRLTICIPPLRLNYAYPDLMRMHTGDGPVSPVVPGAPRLKPRQLPDEDDSVAFDGRFENQRPLSSGMWRMYAIGHSWRILTLLSSRVVVERAHDTGR